MVSKRNYLLYHNSTTLHLHLATFYAQNTSVKKLTRKMIIEQIIEFQLKEAGPPDRSYAPITG